MSSSHSSQERTLDDLDPRVFDQFRSAQNAAKQGEHEYVIRLCTIWARTYPDVVDFRELLRESQISQYPPQAISTIRSSITLACANATDPLHKITQIENALKNSPLHIQANHTLATTANELGWTRTSIFAWRTLLRNPNRQASHVVELGSFLIQQEMSADAISLCEVFLRVFPGDRSIIETRNRASIRQSIEKVKMS